MFCSYGDNDEGTGFLIPDSSMQHNDRDNMINSSYFWGGNSLTLKQYSSLPFVVYWGFLGFYSL